VPRRPNKGFIYLPRDSYAVIGSPTINDSYLELQHHRASYSIQHVLSDS